MFSGKLLVFASMLFASGSFSQQRIGKPVIKTHVTCAKLFMQLDIQLNPDLWQRIQTRLVIHLTDKKCKPFSVNNTHVVVRAPLYSCGTKMEFSKDYVICTNTFNLREEIGASELVSFIPDVAVDFRCTYDREKILLLTGPLQLDKLHSSSHEVETYFGLPVELRCAFKYGAPPVRSVILRGGLIVANQENGTNTVKISVGRRNSEYGLYTCMAEDSNNQKISHNVMLKKIDPSKISTDGKTVTCSRDGMQLTLDLLTYPWLQSTYFNIHLIDNRCRPYLVNLTHIMVKTPYRDCKTTVKNSSRRITYYNILMAFVRVRSSKVITRIPNVFFPFQCHFEHKKVASISTELNDVSVTYPSERLRSDKMQSTPRFVRSFQGFEVRLVCAFSGGVSPVTISLSKGERRLTEGVLVKGKVLFVTVKTNRTTAFGSYDCIAKDAKGTKVKQRITLHKAGPHDMKSDGLTVTCKSHQMDVILSRLVYPWLDPNVLNLSLIQSDCSTYNVTDTYVRIQVPLFGCGTTIRFKNKFVLESRNMVIIRARRPRGVKVTYLPQIHFALFCAYEMVRSRRKTTLRAIEPLALDTSESSSSRIFSPLNMAIKLRCVFRGGEPPIKLSISRHKVMIAHAQGRTLGLLLKASFENGGGYVCRATDARERSVTHVINLRVPVSGIISNKGAEVYCGSQFTTVVLTRAQYPWFTTKRMRMHLKDPICKPSINSTHVTFNLPLGGCGSKHITSSNKVMFYNRVFIVNKPFYKFKERIMEVHFSCKYRVLDSPGQKIKGFL